MGRAALVSGGGRGIGRAISLALARDGADIAVNYRRDRDAAAQTVKDIQALGRRAVAVQASVDDWDADVAMVDRIVDALGPPSILVHNSGVASRGHSVVDTPLEDLDRAVRTHAFGGFYLAKLCIPHMREQPRGDIVMVSSVATKTLEAHGSPYNMGKAALEALALTLAKELQADGIRVNIVAPGLVATEMGDRLVRALSDGAVSSAEQLDGQFPFGHVCRPEDVAEVVRWLTSDAAGYISGARIPVDGGGASRARYTPA